MFRNDLIETDVIHGYAGCTAVDTDDDDPESYAEYGQFPEPTSSDVNDPGVISAAQDPVNIDFRHAGHGDSFRVLVGVRVIGTYSGGEFRADDPAHGTTAIREAVRTAWIMWSA